MLFCDLNCDMGEGMANENLIMPFISSANIACGFHAGNSDMIRRTIDLAMDHGVKIGAHPSFRDKENFGRKEIHLSSDKLYAIVLEQLIKIEMIAKEKGAVLHHVKPHGALYNMAARNAAIASTIATAVKDFNDDLVLYGLSGSHLISEAAAIGLKTSSEVFADRTYQDDGSLTPRYMENALIESEEKTVKQVWEMTRNGTVTTITGNTIPILAQTVCIHGDSRKAVFFARKIHSILQQDSVVSQTI